MAFVSTGFGSGVIPKSSTRVAWLRERPARQGHGNVRMSLVGSSRQPLGTKTFSRKRGHLSVEFPALPPATASNTGDSFRYAWARGKYTRLGRSVKLYIFMAQLLARNYAIGLPATYWMFDKTDEAVSNRRRRLSAWAREEIVKSGPCLIKVGQLASTRGDIFPSEVVEELALLQDRVPGIPYPVIEKVVEEELGMPISKAFVEFDQIPLAAASLGQVHRARLLTDKGFVQDVVVKVQRPALQGLFNVDLENLRIVAEYLQNSKKFGGKGRDWVGIYEECKTILMEELEYEREGRNAEKFAQDLSDVDWIRVPRVYWERTSRRVLTMQYVPGIKISDNHGLERAGLDPRVVARRSAESYLRQILGSGLFHADPHSGNVAVGPGEILYYYDFGMMGQLKTGVKDKLIDLLVGVVQKDAEVVMNYLFDLGALIRVADPSPIRRSIQYFLDNLQSRPMKEQTVAAIGDDLYAVAYDKPFRFPATFTFVLRAFSTLEGINKTLDPEFRFSEVAQPFTDDILESRSPDGIFGGNPLLGLFLSGTGMGSGQPIAGQLQKTAREQLPATLTAPGRIAKIDKALERIERGDTKLRARTTETERLLRKQYRLTQSTNYAYATGILAVCATQLATAGQSNVAAGLGATAGLVALLYMREANELKKDAFGGTDEA